MGLNFSFIQFIEGLSVVWRDSIKFVQVDRKRMNSCWLNMYILMCCGMFDLFSLLSLLLWPQLWSLCIFRIFVIRKTVYRTKYDVIVFIFRISLFALPFFFLRSLASLIDIKMCGEWRFLFIFPYSYFRVHVIIDNRKNANILPFKSSKQFSYILLFSSNILRIRKIWNILRTKKYAMNLE